MAHPEKCDGLVTCAKASYPNKSFTIKNYFTRLLCPNGDHHKGFVWVIHDYKNEVKIEKDIITVKKGIDNPTKGSPQIP